MLWPWHILCSYLYIRFIRFWSFLRQVLQQILCDAHAAYEKVEKNICLLNLAKQVPFRTGCGAFSVKR